MLRMISLCLISTDDFVEMTREQKRLHDERYDSARQKIISLGKRATSQHVFALIQELKQICNYAPNGDSPKAGQLKERLEDVDPESKSLVFSFFKEKGVEPLVERLAEYKPGLITGETTTREKDRIVKRFSDAGSDCRILIGTLGAMREGLNLQAAQYVFHFDHWWNPAWHDQATGRARRIGGHSVVFEYHIWTKDSIEERIKGILDRKKALFDRLIDDLSTVTVETLTEEELFSLFDLEAPSAKRRKTTEDLLELSLRSSK